MVKTEDGIIYSTSDKLPGIKIKEKLTSLKGTIHERKLTNNFSERKKKGRT